MRHGTPHSAEEDPEKSLNSIGREQCKTAGEALKRLNLNAGLVVSSPKVRALQTAEIVAESLEYNKDDIKVTSLLEPNGSPKDVLSYLKDFLDKSKVLLVGHLPLLPKIASELINTEPCLSMNFETACVCRIDVDELAENSGTLRWFLLQEQLKFIANKSK